MNICEAFHTFQGFPFGSASKEFTFNAGDLGLIPGLGRSPGEGKVLTPVLLPGEFHGHGIPWWATVHEVTKSGTRLSD